MILKDQDIVEPDIPFEIHDAVPVRPDNIFHLFIGEVRDFLVVKRGVNDDFMCADPVHHIVHAFALTVQ
jgi:hypothetical protein